MTKSELLHALLLLSTQVKGIISRVENENLIAEEPIADVLEALDYLEEDLDHATIDLRKSDVDIT